LASLPVARPAREVETGLIQFDVPATKKGANGYDRQREKQLK